MVGLEEERYDHLECGEGLRGPVWGHSRRALRMNESLSWLRRKATEIVDLELA
jgi:hypothetical protein